ncbi:MAG: efflux RND transporter periplasmic adaptor subunit [Phycisphaerales bacterium]|nr:efflux RND transporter periplasmic adaptor subunit [Phycisphaerales bacterium]
MNTLARLLRPVVAVLRVALPVVFLLAGVFVAMALFQARPEPPRVEHPETPTLVRTMSPQYKSVRLDVEAWGEVKPARTLVLQPQVSGRLLEVSADLSPGALIEAGAVAARVDPADFELALAQAQAGLETARFNLEVERGRGRIARRDWELLGGIAGDLELDEASSQLALRGPHLKEREAALAAAQSRVDQARLALERTRITVPFPALVRTRTGVEGSMVGPASVIATLVGTDMWWVEVGVPLDELTRLEVPGGEAHVEVRLADGTLGQYEGVIERLTGSVDAAGSLARVLLRVDQPMAQSASQAVPLLLGEFVSARLEGPKVDSVLQLPRRVLRDDDVLWVMGVDDRLAIRSAKVLGGSIETVVVDAQLEPGERLVTSSIAVPVEGLLLADDTVQ